MLIGIDVYHKTGKNAQSVFAFCSTTDRFFSKFYHFRFINFLQVLLRSESAGSWIRNRNANGNLLSQCNYGFQGNLQSLPQNYHCLQRCTTTLLIHFIVRACLSPNKLSSKRSKQQPCKQQLPKLIAGAKSFLSASTKIQLPSFIPKPNT